MSCVQIIQQKCIYSVKEQRNQLCAFNLMLRVLSVIYSRKYSFWQQIFSYKYQYQYNYYWSTYQYTYQYLAYKKLYLSTEQVGYQYQYQLQQDCWIVASRRGNLADHCKSVSTAVLYSIFKSASYSWEWRFRRIQWRRRLRWNYNCASNGKLWHSSISHDQAL